MGKKEIWILNAIQRTTYIKIWLILQIWPVQQAAFGIADIQKFYDLDIEDIIEGLLIDTSSNIHHKSRKKLTFDE